MNLTIAQIRAYIYSDTSLGLTSNPLCGCPLRLRPLRTFCTCVNLDIFRQHTPPPARAGQSSFYSSPTHEPRTDHRIDPDRQACRRMPARPPGRTALTQARLPPGACSGIDWRRSRSPMCPWPPAAQDGHARARRQPKGFWGRCVTHGSRNPRAAQGRAATTPWQGVHHTSVTGLVRCPV